jgi:hypothetical protein
MERPRIIDIVGHGPHAACDRRNCSGLMIALDEHERGRPACAGIASASIGRLRSRQAIQTVQSAFVRQALRFLRLLFRR